MAAEPSAPENETSKTDGADAKFRRSFFREGNVMPKWIRS
jgi:hypothetical protein